MSGKFDIRELCDDEKNNIANIYQHITSKVYVQQNEREIMTDFRFVKAFLNVEAQMYNLDGYMAKIHECIFIEDYDEFTIPELISYIHLLNYDNIQDILEEITDKMEESINTLTNDSMIEKIKNDTRLMIAKLLYDEHLARLEYFRIQKYIQQLFFGNNDTREQTFPGITFWHEIPELVDIMEKNINYYYFRIGELTVPGLVERYTYQELLHFAMIFGQRKTNTDKNMTIDKNDILFVPTTTTSEQELARAICLFIEDVKFDPRIYLTHQSFANTIIQEENETLLSINQDQLIDVEDLFVACTAEGIKIKDDNDIFHPTDILFEEYTMVQLSPTFLSHIGDHRTLYQAVINKTAADGTNLNDTVADEIVFMGIRDGMSNVEFYTIKELYDVFKQMEDFYDPQTIRMFPTDYYMWERFSHKTIYRLLTKVLPYKNDKYAVPLMNLINNLFNRAIDKKHMPLYKRGKRYQNELIKHIQSINHIGKELVRDVLVRMFNVGHIFINLDNEFLNYDEDGVSMILMNDPLDTPPEPKWTGRPQAELRDLMIRLVTTITNMGEERNYFERLLIVRTWNDKFVLDYTNELYQIGTYFLTINEMITLSLFQQLIISGTYLAATANYYHTILFNYPLTYRKLDFDQNGLDDMDNDKDYSI